MNEPRVPSLWLALLPVVLLVGLLIYTMQVAGLDDHLPDHFISEFLGAAQLSLLAGGVIVAIIGLALRYQWKDLGAGVVKGIRIGLPSIFILLAIGVLIGSWLASGVVPLLIVYGLHLLSPEVFLVATCLICGLVSLVTGSSWTTAGTIGVALIGVGEGLEISKAMTAGAIVSGSYFGDKLSPLSDTTNLAAGVAEVPLFTHIRHMLWTTVPSLLIALVVYAVLGMRAGGEGSAENVTLLVETMEANFSLSPVLLLAPASVIACLVFRLPALVAILIGAAVGSLLALVVEGVAIGTLVPMLYSGYELNTGVEAIDELLSGGGLSSMFWTIGLVLCALSFGGLMECTKMLQTIVQAIMRFAVSTGRLVLSTLASSLGMNLMAADQYLAIIMPGRMFKEAYEEAGLDPRNLSRCLEDSGTITSPLIPWNSCGATMMGALKVDPLHYAPYAIFNLVCPLVSAVLGFTGWTMMKRPQENGEKEEGESSLDPPSTPN